MCDKWKKILNENNDNWNDIKDINYNKIIKDAHDPQIIIFVKFTFENGKEIIVSAEQKRIDNKIALICNTSFKNYGNAIISFTFNGVNYSKRHNHDTLLIYEEPIYKRIIPGCKPITGYNSFILTGIHIFQSKKIIISFMQNNIEIIKVIGVRLDENKIKFYLGDV